MSVVNRSSVLLTTGTAMVVVALLPSFLVPLYQDDLVFETADDATFHGSLWQVIEHAWSSDPQPNRFNPVGREFSHLYHFTAHQFGLHLGGDPLPFYRSMAIVMLVLALACGSDMICSATRWVGMTPWRFAPVYAVLSGLAAVTLQQHPWFFDPTLVASEVGLPATALGLLVLSLTIRVLTHRALRTPSVYLLVATAVVGCLFYETVLTAIAGATLLVSMQYVRAPSDRPRLRAIALWSVALPAVIFIAGHVYIATRHLPPYAGTQPRLTAQALKPAFVLSLNLVPGSAWGIVHRYAGVPPVTWHSLGCCVLLVLLAAAVMGMLRSTDFSLPDDWRPFGRALSGLVVFVVGTIALHSMNAKYIQTLTYVGNTYISYSTFLIASSLAILLAVDYVFTRHPRWVRSFWAKGALGAVLVAFTFYQTGVNWQVDRGAASTMRMNRMLVNATLDGSLPAGDRCHILSDWLNSQGGPNDVSNYIALRVNEGYQIDFGQQFCPATQ
jgi:hypothetical protein